MAIEYLRPSSVNVVGEVLSPTTHTFKSRSTINDYLSLSGGLREAADKDSIFVVLPNGEAQKITSGMFKKKINLLPGSTIVVPKDTRPVDWFILGKVFAPVITSLAISTATIAAIDDD